MREYRVIDADAHVLEPPDLWERRLDAEYRRCCPRVIRNADGSEVFRVDDNYTVDSRQGSGSFTLGGLGAIGSRCGRASKRIPYLEGMRGGFDPNARILYMDSEGIDAAFLYPSLGLFLAAIKDPNMAAAACRVYNNWLFEYCQVESDRLFGVAILPMQSSIEQIVDEIRFAAGELGFRAGFVRPNPYNGRSLHHRAYDPVWTAAQNADLAIAIHGGGGSGLPTLGVDRFEGGAVRHAVAHTFEMMAAATSMIMCGVCDKFSHLRVGFLEAGGGWLAGWLDRMDRHFDDEAMNDTGLTLRPSQIYRRQCFVSFEPVEGSLKVLADYLGSETILWASDYPHQDGFLGGPDSIRRLGLSEAALANVLAGGARRFYNVV